MPLLSSVLMLFESVNIISSDLITTTAGVTYHEVLLTAYEWRLLLPMMATKTSAWEDRLLQGLVAPYYEMPEVIRCMVLIAMSRGVWDGYAALNYLFRDQELVDASNKIITVIKELARLKRHVTAMDVVSACGNNKMPYTADFLISIFKSFGIISPKFSDLTRFSHHKGPVYELNPSLVFTMEYKNGNQVK